MKKARSDANNSENTENKILKWDRKKCLRWQIMKHGCNPGSQK